MWSETTGVLALEQRACYATLHEPGVAKSLWLGHSLSTVAIMKPTKRVSLQQIAAEAGVSRATVSRALRNHPAIPPRTRKRIQAIARRWGHATNPLISTLMTHVRATSSGKHLGTLAYLTAWSTRDGWKSNATDTKYFEGAMERARRSGFRLEEFWLKEPGMTSRRMSEILHTRGITGIIVAPLPFPPVRGHLSLHWTDFAAVTLGYSVWRPNLDRVASHYSNNLVRVVHQLRRLGHRRIGFALQEGLDERTDRNMISSFQFLQQGMQTSARIPALTVSQDGKRDFDRWLRANSPDVVISFGGPVLPWLRELGLNVPKDVGFVDLDLHDKSGSIAGIDQHSESLAATAVDLLIAQLHRSEYGLPKLPKLMLMEGTWVSGATVRMQEA